MIVFIHVLFDNCLVCDRTRHTNSRRADSLVVVTRKILVQLPLTCSNFLRTQNVDIYFFLIYFVTLCALDSSNSVAWQSFHYQFKVTYLLCTFGASSKELVRQVSKRHSFGWPDAYRVILQQINLCSLERVFPVKHHSSIYSQVVFDLKKPHNLRLNYSFI